MPIVGRVMVGHIRRLPTGLPIAIGLLRGSRDGFT